MADLFERLKKVIISVPNYKCPKEIEVADSFRDDLQMNSGVVFDLIMGIEDEYGITVEDEDAMKITTVADALDYLEKHVAG